jgi:mycothiol synthase
VERPEVPSATDAAAIRELAGRVEAEDGREPLSDQALADLASSGVRHVLVRGGARVIGYGQLNADSAEIVADRGALDATLDALLGAASTPTVRIWSHGVHSRLAPALQARGASDDRRLHQLRRTLDQPIEVPPAPAGVEITGFEVGHDEQGWLEVNAAAFAWHPEQGRWLLADLVSREKEPWFDPDGFLLARRDGRIVGFHWTKVHPDGAGEVYVIAVHPSEQGSGLGAVLLQRGLAYLQRRGCPSVLLYVDESNAGALRFYERRGFTRYDLDVQWTVRVATSAE